MHSFKVLFALLFLSVLPTNKTFAQPALSNNAFVSLLTCGPGNELYSVFGHTALRVSDPATGIDVVYNYGTFDFDAPNFYMKFVKGDLQYFVSASTYNDFIYTYKYYNRDVYEQVLNLTPEQEQKIFSELNDVLQSDRKFYTYKFIGRNCTTMAGDVIELGSGTKISNKNRDTGKTYRRIIYENLENHFYENLGISLIFGARTDIEMKELFLPVHLMEGVADTNSSGNPLAKPSVTVNKAFERSTPGSWWNNIYLFAGFMIVAAVFSNRRVVYVTFLVIAGLIGFFFSVVGFFSFHEEITMNYNILLLNPLYLLLLAFMLMKNAKATLWTIYTCLGLLVVYLVIMLNKPHLLLVLPIVVLAAAVLIRLRMQTLKGLPRHS